MAINKNIVTDYGADNTGVADIGTPALVNLHTDMIGQDANVTWPVGTYNWTSNGTTWINGVLNLNIIATGATTSGNGVFFQTKHVQQVGLDAVTGGNARIQTANPGATSATLTAYSAAQGHISRFSTGQCVMITGWPTQSSFQAPGGFPPNWAFVEHVTITNIVGNTISFTPALQNYYSDQWPELNRGNNFETDAAGPATIVGLDPFWKGTTTVTDGTWNRGDLINCYRENFIITGSICTGLPVYPSVNKLYRAVNVTATAALTEHDKLNDWVDIQGGTYTSWKCQSSSTRLLTMTGVTLTTGLGGSVQDTILDGCAIAGDATLGPTAYGRAGTFICKNTTIGGTIDGGLVEKGPTVGGTTDIGVDTYMFMSGGVITIPLSLGDFATRTMMPDSRGRNILHWYGTNGTCGSFKVLSATSDSWPAADNQTATVNVTMTNGSAAFQVSSATFTSGDVGKCIIIPNATSGGGTLRTFIAAFTDSQNVTLYNPCTLSGGISASSRALQWGTCNMYIQTDQAGGFPASALWSGRGKLWLQVPPARWVRFENCSGTEQAVDLSQTAAWTRPLHSYTKRQYRACPTAASTGFRLSEAGALAGTGSRVPSVGNIQSLKFNVTKAYTGVQGTLTGQLSQFQIQVAVGGTWVSYAPKVNLKILGERVITIGSTTGTQTGDSGLSLASPTWIPNGFDPALSANISGEAVGTWPEWTIEMITDQGFPAEVPTAVAPLRLRLRAA